MTTDGTSSRTSRFSAYGLDFLSDIPVPWADPSCAGATPDVEVVLGPRGPAGTRGAYTGWKVMSPDLAIMEFEGSRLVAEGGRRLTCFPPADAEPEALAAYVSFGGAMMLLHQRVALPLHAAAAAGPEGAVLFLGDAGAGKSTFASMMTREGWALGADDLAALDFDGPRLGVHRGLPTARLFADASAAIDAGGVAADRSLGFAVGMGKELHRIGDPVAMDWPAPLRAIFTLEWLHPSDSAPEVELLPRLAALARLRAAVARPELAAELKLGPRYFGRLARIVAEVPVFALRRPRRFAAAAAAARLARDTVRGIALNDAEEEKASQ